MTSGQTSTCVCLVVKSPRTALSFAKTILSACTIPKSLQIPEGHTNSLCESYTSVFNPKKHKYS